MCPGDLFASSDTELHAGWHSAIACRRHCAAFAEQVCVQTYLKRAVVADLNLRAVGFFAWVSVPSCVTGILPMAAQVI